MRLFRFGEIDEALIASESRELKQERERLEREQAALTTRLEQADRTVKSLESVTAYCGWVRQRLDALDYAGRRLALEALGVRVTVDGADWRVEAVIPVESGDIALQPS